MGWPLGAMAQDAGRTYHLGVLCAPPRSDDVVIAFLDGVRRQGFLKVKPQSFTTIALHPDLLPEWVESLSKPA